MNSKRWTEQLFSLRVEAPIEPFKAGQFGKLALEINGEMVFRPYSYVNAPHERPLEFYFIMLPNGPLTQRLIELEPGDPIYVSPRAAGFLTLSEVPDAETLWRLSSGTAIGPFLSILKTEEPWRRFQSIVLVHAVRQAEELGVRAVWLTGGGYGPDSLTALAVVGLSLGAARVLVPPRRRNG